MPGCSLKWAFSPWLHPLPANVPGISVSSLTSRMPLHVFVIHSIGFFPPLWCSSYFQNLLLSHFLCLSLSLSGLHISGVTCSFCLYPFPFSFVVTLLYKRISKGNILSRVTLYCTLDTSELRIYSVLQSFSSTVCLHITARINVWYVDEPISLDLSQLGRRFVLVFTGQFCWFWKMGLCCIIALSLIKWKEMKETGSNITDVDTDLLNYEFPVTLHGNQPTLQRHQTAAVNSKQFSNFAINELKFSLRETYWDFHLLCGTARVLTSNKTKNVRVFWQSNDLS